MKMTITCLPGRKAQLAMAPRGRTLDIPEDAVDAAVLALLTPGGEGRAPEDLLAWRVLLIHRNSYPGVHSGQIALPGGKCEREDAGFWDTACREAVEEVGIDRNAVERVGPLSSLYVQPSNFAIHPFVAINHAGEDFRADPREVVDYKNVPIRVFDPAASVLRDFPDKNGARRLAPAWQYEDYTIWGATAMILAELYHLVRSGALARG
ncbi:MAG: CoA pyrophosphatase [Deltaproteobacteria bacterium]|jgi:8-oxo-dGTP pyrophosphatase MutT (NUDIX family)|nr:CoA pyrophosphatase [Deltaproteobacteria bacterium]